MFVMPIKLLGKILFPRKQSWQREREARVLVVAAVIAITFSGFVGAVMLWRNSSGK
jgi:hypothetical protein